MSSGDSPGKPTIKTGAEGNAGDGGADLVESLEEDVCAGAALHGFRTRGRGVLQGDVEIFADVVVPGDWFRVACR